MSTAAERFECKVDRTASECWLWTGCITPSGYGSFWFNGVTSVAHRASYEMHIGPIPEGLFLDHLCRVRHCVNPRHLEPVTHQENTLRGVGLAATNARKTHCPQEHEYSEENTYINARGGRQCRACGRATSREYRERMTAKV